MVAAFECEENFATKESARITLTKVKEAQAQIRDSHWRDTLRECLAFDEIVIALEARIQGENPWEAVERSRQDRKAFSGLKIGRRLVQQEEKPIYTPAIADAAGRCLGTAYKYYLG